MAKELERAGIPTALVTTIVPLAESLGPYRIVAGKAIPHPLGNPMLSREEEKAFRRQLVQKALAALATDAPEPMIVR